MNLSRRDFLLKSALFAGASAFLPVSNLFAARLNNFTELRRNVGMYSNRGGTIGWMVNSDASVVVDSQFPDTAADCLKGIKSKREGGIDALINTHHHGDHTGGNSVFRPETEIIVAHEQVPVLQKIQAQMRGGDDSPTLPDTTFTDSWKKDFGDETVHAQYYGRAHTSGDAVITFEKANVVHMGDLIFNKVFPFIDRQSGASIQNWAYMLGSVVNNHDAETIYIFGHGQPGAGVTGSAQDLLRMQSYLEALLEHAIREQQAGASREEIIGVVSLKGFEDYVSFGPRLSLGANLEVAYDELFAN